MSKTEHDISLDGEGSGDANAATTAIGAQGSCEGNGAATSAITLGRGAELARSNALTHGSDEAAGIGDDDEDLESAGVISAACPTDAATGGGAYAASASILRAASNGWAESEGYSSYGDGSGAGAISEHDSADLKLEELINKKNYEKLFIKIDNGIEGTALAVAASAAEALPAPADSMHDSQTTATTVLAEDAGEGGGGIAITTQVARQDIDNDGAPAAAASLSVSTAEAYQEFRNNVDDEEEYAPAPAAAPAPLPAALDVGAEAHVVMVLTGDASEAEGNV